MQIKTKFLPATDTQGERIKAMGFGKTKTIPYDYALSPYLCHLKAAHSLWKKLSGSSSRPELVGDNIPRGKSRAVGYIFEAQKEKHYMNPVTGSVGTFEDWYYENENGFTVNAVELREVVEVEWIKDGWALVLPELR